MLVSTADLRQGPLSSHAMGDQNNKPSDFFSSFMNRSGGLPRGQSSFSMGDNNSQKSQPPISMLSALEAASNFPSSISAQCSLPNYGGSFGTLSGPGPDNAKLYGSPAGNDTGLSYQAGSPLSGSFDMSKSNSSLRDFNDDGGQSYRGSGPLSGSFDMSKNISSLRDFNEAHKLPAIGKDYITVHQESDSQVSNQSSVGRITNERAQGLLQSSFGSNSSF